MKDISNRETMKLLVKIGTHSVRAINVKAEPKLGDKFQVFINNEGSVGVRVYEIRETGMGTVFFVERW